MNVQRISALPFPLQISFTLPTDRYTGRAVTIQTCAQPVFQADFCEGLPTINATYHWLCNTERFGPSPTFTYTLTSPASGRHIQIVFLSHVIRLYVDNQLQDEEWPLGSPTAGIWEIIYPTDVSDVTAQPLDAIQQPMPAPPVQALHGLVPDGHNTGVGDCMPFVDNNTLHLYYLFDRRSHQSKNALGAHQWAHMSTTDLCNWDNHPIAVGITEQWEGSICTGSVIRHKDTYYAFYAVRMSDGSPAKMTWATSQDGIHFEKSGQYFSLSSPYEPVSARDPMVFADDNGVYHMLVTTSLVDVENGGCLAHLTSHDLLNWEQHAPFYVPGFADQPECSDYFRWNGWYYLVFSNYGTARYRMSRNPVGPWLRPEDDTLDSLEIRVPKVARLHNKCYSIGFLNRRNGTYAGSAIIHELYQRDNGSLGVKFLPSAFPAHETFAVPTPPTLKLISFLAPAFLQRAPTIFVCS